MNKEDPNILIEVLWRIKKKSINLKLKKYYNMVMKMMRIKIGCYSTKQTPK